MIPILVTAVLFGHYLGQQYYRCAYVCMYVYFIYVYVCVYIYIYRVVCMHGCMKEGCRPATGYDPDTCYSSAFWSLFGPAALQVRLCVCLCYGVFLCVCIYTHIHIHIYINIHRVARHLPSEEARHVDTERCIHTVHIYIYTHAYTHTEWLSIYPRKKPCM
jgi:hypothetical protein